MDQNVTHERGNVQIPDVEKTIVAMRDETIREISKERISAATRVAWYWSYIGSLDMAQQLGLISDARRQALYREMAQYKPVCEIKHLDGGKPTNHLVAVEMGAEANYNQIDGIINNEAPKPSLRETLQQYQEEVGKPQSVNVPPCPNRDPER